MRSILVIEDEKILRESIVQLLGFAGYQCFAAENGSIGVQVALQECPDVIVCDIRMPEMDGFDVIREIRANPITTNVPFIFLSAKADNVDIELGMQLGANVFVTKPFSHDKLIAAIDSCFG